MKERLERVKRQRSTQRRSRERSGTFRVSLVGYTNAGKSTLFNALVKARAYAADQLFATLDTTTRQLYLATRRRRARCPCPTPSASSATCRTSWSRPSRPRCRRRTTPICCCTWSTASSPHARRAAGRSAACAAPRSAPTACRRCSSTTSSTGSNPTQRPRVLRDVIELDGGVRVPRVFVSALDRRGRSTALRAVLARAVALGDLTPIDVPPLRPHRDAASR